MQSEPKPEAVVIKARHQPLATLSNHSDVTGLERYLHCSDIHIAVHHFDGTHVNPHEGEFIYTQVHAHNVREYDIVIPQDENFMLQLETGGQLQFIHTASTIIIPAGVPHRMEAIRGKGLMVCIVCATNYEASLINCDQS